jgi:hypothetical protein
VSTNPFITPPISSFGKDTYSSNVLTNSINTIVLSVILELT